MATPVEGPTGPQSAASAALRAGFRRATEADGAASHNVWLPVTRPLGLP